MPFTIWPCLISAVGGGTIVEIGKNILYTYLTPASGGLWFLYVLFLCHFVLFISNFIKEKSHINREVIFVALILFVYVLHYVIGVDCLGMNELPWFILFYFSGHIIGQKVDITKKSICKSEYFFFSLFVIFFVILFPYWRRTEITPLLSDIQINPFIVSFANVFFKYLVALCGIGIVMFVSKVVSDLKLSVLNIAFLGRHTIDIYILHLIPFNLIIIENSMLNVVIKTVLGILCGLLIGYIVRNGIIEMCLFGTFSSKKVYNGGK